MSDPTSGDRVGDAHAAAGARPAPQYGEYASPEEQRARIRQPDASYAIDTGQAPAEVAADARAAGPTPSGDTRGRRRRVDRIVTIALLAWGALNIVLTVPSYYDLAELADRSLQMIGVDGSFTNFDAARIWGPVAAVAVVVGFVITALLAVRRLRAGRLAWWVPVVGAVGTYLVVCACLVVPVLGDPAFIDHVTRVSTG